MSDLKKALRDFGFSERLLNKIYEERPAFEFEPQDIVQGPQYTDSENILIDSNMLSGSTNIMFSIPD
ncbi:MAG: hypothetical protein GY846_00315 [Deltaproteobacteria bacterium]|nr:hypothetical protein [Deltaproteobacteria bacterium]